MGKDEHTNAVVTPEGTTKVRDATTGNMVDRRVEVDHITSIGEMHANKKAQLGMGTVIDGHVDVTRIREMVNHDDNLALTNQPANGSKNTRISSNGLRQCEMMALLTQNILV